MFFFGLLKRIYLFIYFYLIIFRSLLLTKQYIIVARQSNGKLKLEDLIEPEIVAGLSDGLASYTTMGCCHVVAERLDLKK